MPAVGSLTPPGRAFAELLAEARARTLLLVSPLSEGEMAHQPEPEVGSVLSELIRIVNYEAHWLLDESEHPPLASYDEWFDHMTDVRQRVLQTLDEGDLGDESAVAQRFRRVLEHEYQRGEAILETLGAGGEPYSPARSAGFSAGAACATRHHGPRARRGSSLGASAGATRGAAHVHRFSLRSRIAD
jgi:hypothetical protein